jgi:hypothetical protein
VGTPVPFQRCLAFVIASATKEFTLTAGKFVPVSNVTMLNVSMNTHYTERFKKSFTMVFQMLQSGVQ